MTTDATNTEIPMDGYAVVYHYASGPAICRPIRGGKVINGQRLAIYDNVNDAIDGLRHWANPDRANYGIAPVRTLVEEKTVTTYVFKDRALSIGG